MDTVRDARYHNAKNCRKRRDKTRRHVQRRDFLGRTPSHLKPAPRVTTTFRPLALLDLIQYLAAAADAMRWCRCHLTRHAWHRMQQRGILVRELGSPRVHVVLDEATSSTIITVWCVPMPSARAVARRHRRAAKAVKAAKAAARRAKAAAKAAARRAKAAARRRAAKAAARRHRRAVSLAEVGPGRPAGPGHVRVRHVVVRHLVVEDATFASAAAGPQYP